MESKTYTLFLVSTILFSLSIQAISVAPTTSPRLAPKPSPTRSPQLAPKQSPTSSPQLAPRTSPTRSPQLAPKISPTASPRLAPKASPTQSPQFAPKISKISMPPAPASAPEVPSTPTLKTAVSTLISNIADTISGSAVDPELKKICDQTDHPALCTSFVLPHFHGNAEPVTILKLAIKSAVEKTEFALTEAARLEKEMASSSPYLPGIFDTCKENFGTAIDNLKSAVCDIDIHDLSKLHIDLSAALTDFDTCDDTFEEREIESPMAKLNDALKKMVGNIIDISRLLS